MIATLKNTIVDTIPTQSSNSFPAQTAVSNLALFPIILDQFGFSKKNKTTENQLNKTKNKKSLKL